MAKSENARRFNDYDETAATQARQEIDRVEAVNYFKIKVGRNVVRFLPGIDNSPAIVRAYTHWIEVDGGRGNKPKKLSFNCPRMMARKPCPECEFEVKLESTNAADAEYIRGRRAVRTCYANVIDRGLADDECAPKEFRFKKTIDDQLESIRKEFHSFTNVLSGYDISITRPPNTNGGEDTVFPVNRGQATPLDPDGEWVRTLVSLQRRLYVPSYQEVVAIMNGEDSTARGGSGPRIPAERHLPGPATVLPKTRTVADDVEEDDDDDDDDEDE